MNHFAREIQLAGTIADDASNLQDVIREKLCHIERYRQFAEDAEKDGDLKAAFLFRTIIDDDQLHLRALDHRIEERCGNCQGCSEQSGRQNP